MRRQEQYADPGMNQMIAAQMQHTQPQRSQHSAGMGYPGRADEEHQYMSSKADGQWQWNRDGPKGSQAMSPHMYKEGQAIDASRPSYQGQIPDPKLGLEKQAIKDPRAVEADMEVGYEDNPIPQTFEGLEQKFIQDIMELTKELQDAEDKENARHRERLSEINSQYQEKLLAMRVRQATKREEILRIESQARHQQYQQQQQQQKQQQQASMVTYQSGLGPADPHDYGLPGGTHSRVYGGASVGEIESTYEDRARNRLYAHQQQQQPPRGQYPGGRAYNSGGRYF